MATTAADIEHVLKLLHDKLEEAQNDNLTLQGRLEEVKEQCKAQSRDNDYLRSKLASVQQDNANYSKTQTRLETQLYAQEQDGHDLRKQIQQLVKARRDMESKLEAELNVFESDRVAWQQKEVEMYNQIRTLSMGEPRTPRTPRRPQSALYLAPVDEHTDDQTTTAAADHAGGALNVTPSVSSPLALRAAPKLASADSAREHKIAQRTIKAQDRMIIDLRAELDKQQSQALDRERQSGQQDLRIQQLEHELASIKQVNRSLQEDNESYQILLHEKTISGEFMMNPIMQVSSDQDKPETPSNGALNLAAELNMANDVEASQKEAQINHSIQKLTDEVKTLQDTNRALQLYMNKILMKIIDNKQLEDVLSIDQPKKKAPSPEPVSAEPMPTTPTPTKTFSSSLLAKTTSRQQRRRTISYWGSKNGTPPLPEAANGAAVPEPTPVALDEAPSHEEIKARRHTVLSAAETTSTARANDSGWTKALRRMSFGWAATPTIDVKEELTLPSSTTPPAHAAAILQQSTASPLSSDMQLSQSGSSTTASSLRASNELGTLQEE
ncbi:hypothetical protein BC940DRAFT_299272 [Gongronella butleri]|nr:hypothetical protein BC940DRAFT_299272 [Gongronella butleri]